MEKVWLHNLVRQIDIEEVCIMCWCLLAKGTMFLKAIDATLPGLIVTGEFIYMHIWEAIMEVGAENVKQVVTDNGSNCVSVGRMLE